MGNRCCQATAREGVGLGTRVWKRKRWVPAPASPPPHRLGATLREELKNHERLLVVPPPDDVKDTADLRREATQLRMRFMVSSRAGRRLVALKAAWEALRQQSHVQQTLSTPPQATRRDASSASQYERYSCGVP